MAKNYFKSFLLVIICANAISNHVVAAEASPAFHESEGGVNNRKFMCLPDHGRKSFNLLMEENPQLLDEDYFANFMMAPQKMASSMNLSHGFPEPSDQGTLGSCTAHALTSILLYDIKRQNDEKIVPILKSTLYLYWWSRYLEGTVPYDSGVSISDAILALKTRGVCNADLWPYDIDTFNIAKTTKEMDADALDFKCAYPIKASSVAANLETMKTLLNRGIPFVAGLRIYESFDSKVVESTGVVPMPKTKKEKYKGRHAVVFAGYDDEKYGGSFFVRNSWGKKWGTSFNGKDDVNGYCWLPYKYATNPSLSRDFWTISKMVVQEKADLSDDDANTSNSCWEFFFEKRKNGSNASKYLKNAPIDNDKIKAS